MGYYFLAGGALIVLGLHLSQPRRVAASKRRAHFQHHPLSWIRLSGAILVIVAGAVVISVGINS